jgi:small-conductance mechanosensitive channel
VGNRNFADESIFTLMNAIRFNLPIAAFHLISIKKKTIALNFQKIIRSGLFITFLLCSAIQIATAQKIDSVQNKIDSLRRESKHHNVDTSVANLLKKTESVTHILNNVKSILSRGFDTAEISAELPTFEFQLENLSNNFQNNQRVLSLRNLKIIKTVLGNASKELKKWQELLLSYSTEMHVINDELDNLIQDTASLFISEDSTISKNYLKQIISFTNKWKKADSSNKINLQKIDLLQNRVTNALITNSELSDETVYRIKYYSKNLLKPEEKSIWNASSKDYSQSFSDVLKNSFFIAMKIIGIYLSTKNINIVICMLLILCMGYWFKISSRKLRKMQSTDALIVSNTNTISTYPFLSAILIFTSLSPFFSEEEPSSFAILIWLMVALVYSIIFIKENMIRLKMEWFALIILFLLVNALNLLTIASLMERWVHLVFVILSMALGFDLYIRVTKYETQLPKSSKYFLILFLILLTISFLLNVIGCYTLSKYLAGGALTGLLTARILYTVIDIIIEAIYIQYETYKDESKFISYFDYFRLKSKLQKALYVFVSIVWLIILTRNLNFYDVIYENVSDFLSEDRTLGNIQFTFSSILIFVLVIWVSNLISKTLLLIFGSDTGSINNKKNKWGSTLLLTRLTVLILGIIVAFIASGIPMDKITIIIGALGVGIGFGLQNIVNNLVSGIILAFEKPVQVGDAIEVGNKYGIVKEIGIRSSKLTTVEGSDVIIPNGDLLSQHIVNWTLSNHFRRVEIIVGVSYQSDLRKVEALLKDILKNEKGIQQQPAPNVIAHVFGASSVDFRLLFWCDIDSWINTKSEVLITIYQRFNEEHIQIPFPQTDVHIKKDE